jgi:hypothetical protein
MGAGEGAEAEMDDAGAEPCRVVARPGDFRRQGGEGAP